MNCSKWTIAAMVLLLALASTPLRAQGPYAAPYAAPSATIQLEIVKGSYIFGITGGSGSLYFQGTTIPITVAGASVGLSIGAAATDYIGEVYGLASPYDIEGSYAATKASYAAAGGESFVSLQNARGVEIQLRGKQLGLEISLDLSGIFISID